MEYIEVEKGVRLAVESINGAGAKTVVLVHGWPLNRKMFEYQLNVLPQWGFHCVTLDLRGFGDSDKPWHGYDYDRLADDLYEVIDCLETKEIILVGFSIGGAIVIRYMARHMGYKVKKLALLAAAAPSFTRRPGYPYGTDPEEVNALIAQLYEDRPKVVADFGSQLFAQSHSPEIMEWLFALGLEAAGYSSIKTQETLRDADLQQDLGKIKVPTGIFHGVLDKICPFELAVLMNRGIPNSQLIPFYYSGHGIFYDELELFNQLFLEFLMQ